MFMLTFIFVGRIYESFCCRVVILLLEIQLSKGENWVPINGFNLAICMCLSQARTRISNVICRDLFCDKVRGDCSCCWYWWNCWLFNLSFHNLLFQHSTQIYIFYLSDCNADLLCLTQLTAIFQLYHGDQFWWWESRSTRREPPTMGKQLVNFITYGCESSAPFL